MGEEFVVCGEPRLASEQPVHFGERDAEVFPFDKDVGAPGKSEVNM
jgi:hypothetical protein